MKKLFLCALILWLTFLSPNFYAWGDKGVFFKNTFFPLRVYYVKGKQPGPTLMIQGGIQGDELTGVICATLLTRAKVKKGNLIIVPRANWPSLFLFKRQVNVDLNRRFDKHYATFYEDTLAKAIFYLVGLSDGLIHLHEGSGFYSPRYINSLRNPKRYGQSIIIDESKYGKIILEDIARSPLQEVNQNLQPKQFRFNLFNMRTFSNKTTYKEQRKSLTYNFLKHYVKPALAIEVSKQIQDKVWKTKYMLKIIQKLAARLGVTYELKGINVEQTVRNWFNEPYSYQIRSLSKFVKIITLTQPKFARLGVKLGKIDIDLNHQQFVLFPGANLSAKIIADGHPIKTINFKTAKKPKTTNAFPVLVYNLNGKIKLAFPGETITAREGQTLLIYGLWPNSKEVINIKGYAPKTNTNTGQDQLVPVYLRFKSFLSKYVQTNSTHWSFQIVRETPGTTKLSWQVKVNRFKKPPVLLLSSPSQRIVLPTKSKLTAGKYKIIPVGMTNLIFLLDKQPLPFYPQESFFLSPGQHVLRVFDNLTFDQLQLIQLNVGETHAQP